MSNMMKILQGAAGSQDEDLIYMPMGNNPGNANWTYGQHAQNYITIIDPINRVEKGHISLTYNYGWGNYGIQRARLTLGDDDYIYITGTHHPNRANTLNGNQSGYDVRDGLFRVHKNSTTLDSGSYHSMFHQITDNFNRYSWQSVSNANEYGTMFDNTTSHFWITNGRGAYVAGAGQSGGLGHHSNYPSVVAIDTQNWPTSITQPSDPGQVVYRPPNHHTSSLNSQTAYIAGNSGGKKHGITTNGKSGSDREYVAAGTHEDTLQNADGNIHGLHGFDFMEAYGMNRDNSGSNPAGDYTTGHYGQLNGVGDDINLKLANISNTSYGVSNIPQGTGHSAPAIFYYNNHYFSREGSGGNSGGLICVDEGGQAGATYPNTNAIRSNSITASQGIYKLPNGYALGLNDGTGRTRSCFRVYNLDTLINATGTSTNINTRNGMSPDYFEIPSSVHPNISSIYNFPAPIVNCVVTNSGKIFILSDYYDSSTNRIINIIQCHFNSTYTTCTFSGGTFLDSTYPYLISSGANASWNVWPREAIGNLTRSKLEWNE